jgi:hypothetical protein
MNTNTGETKMTKVSKEWIAHCEKMQKLYNDSISNVALNEANQEIKSGDVITGWGGGEFIFCFIYKTGDLLVCEKDQDWKNIQNRFLTKANFFNLKCKEWA